MQTTKNSLFLADPSEDFLTCNSLLVCRNLTASMKNNKLFIVFTAIIDTFQRKC